MIDYSTLTDDEISERLSKARRYLNQMVGTQHLQLVDSIRVQIYNLEDEQARRIQKVISDNTKKEMLAKGIDPDAPITLGHVEGDPKPIDRILKRGK